MRDEKQFELDYDEILVVVRGKFNLKDVYVKFQYRY